MNSSQQLLQEFSENKHANMLSQKAQDYWVNGILKNKIGGFFLDLAAADGLEHSNTYFFEKQLGWTGILIEPNPEFFALLKQNRTSTCVDKVVSNEKHMIDFRYDNGQLGGIVADDTDNSERIRGEQLKEGRIESRWAVPLNEILAENNAPDFIDYFSLDVEGAEERVISTLDFKTYKFRLISIERANPNVNNILFQNGYQFVRNCRFDTFYAHSDIIEQYQIETEPFSQVPDKNW